MLFIACVKEFSARGIASAHQWVCAWWGVLLYWLFVAVLTAIPLMLGYSVWWLFLSFPATVVLAVLILLLWLAVDEGVP